MEPLTEALTLMKRQTELETRLRQPGGIRVTEEREIYALRLSLQRYPEAVKAILHVAANLHRTVDTLSVDDVRRAS
jgi:hypothetical protein